MRHLRPRTIGLVFLSGTILAWGLNWPVMKLLLAELPPLSARAAAGFIAAGTMAAVLAGTGRALSVPRPLWPRLALHAGLNVTAWMGATTAGMVFLPAGEAAIIAYTMPVWTALLAWPVLGERPGARHLLALALGIAGLVLLLGGVRPDPARLPGFALLLTGAIGFALGTVLAKRVPLPLPSAVSVCWQVGLGCVPMQATAFLFETPDFASLSGQGWLILLYVAAVPLCLAYLCWFAALRRLPAGAASLATLGTPVVGVLASIPILGDPLTGRVLLALALTLGGILLAVRR